MNQSMNPWLRGVVAVIAGGLLAGIIAVWVIPNEPAPQRARPDAVEEFLTRWERWRRAEFVAEEITLRRDGERETSESVTIAQKWPDRVVRNGTAVSARVGSRVVGCTGGGSAGDGPVCLDTGGFDPPLELQMELDAIRAEVDGRTPRYRLTRTTPGCFRLRHVVDEFRSEFGDRVDYCFDPDPDPDPDPDSRSGGLGNDATGVARRIGDPAGGSSRGGSPGSRTPGARLEAGGLITNPQVGGVLADHEGMADRDDMADRGTLAGLGGMTPQIPVCPGCSTALTRTTDGELDTWQCPMLHGSAMTLSEAHGRLQDDEVAQTWASTRSAEAGAGARPCPICRLSMKAVLVSADDDEVVEGAAGDGANLASVWLDVCEPCQLIWFDAGELADFPTNLANPPISDEERQQVEAVARQFGAAVVQASHDRDEQTFTERVYRTVAKNRTLLTALTTVGRVGRD